MASPSFDDLVQEADETIASTFGEAVLIMPRVVMPKHAPAVDVDRLPGTVTGVFTLNGKEGPIVATRRGELAGLVDLNSIALADATVWLPATSIEALGYTPRKDDAVTLPDRDGTTYVVVRADPSQVRDLVLHIDRENAAP